MMYKIAVDLPNNKILQIELDDTMAPRTVRSLVRCLPISVIVHVWGEELYTDPIPVVMDSENSRSLVERMDVAYWLPGKAICLFFGPTPIGKKGEIKPYSPVNVIGRINEIGAISHKDVKDGSTITFRLIE